MAVGMPWLGSGGSYLAKEELARGKKRSGDGRAEPGAWPPAGLSWALPLDYSGVAFPSQPSPSVLAEGHL